MPPISWTSYGTMSHFNPWPVTTTSRDSRRRLAARTVAKAAARTSARAACSSLPYAASARASWSESAARCPASGQSCFSRFSRSTSATSAVVRCAIAARSFGVCAWISASESALSRSSWRRIPSTTGRSRFSSRLNRLPRIFVNRLLTISPLVIQPVGGDVLAHPVGYEIADRASALDVLPDRGRRDVERRHLDDAADQGMPGHAGPGAGEHDDIREAAQRRPLYAGPQVLVRGRPPVRSQAGPR